MAYDLPQEFEWDDAKSRRCEAERGVSFTDILPAFFDPDRHIEADDRREYGEDRFQLYGHVGERLFVVVFTVRDSTIRIISARRANRRERKNYGESQSKG
ncbi:MAG: BrnT family toxin [Rhodospirillales bacterium]|jgi:hypothetical protein